jgi:O-antigen ligase
MGPVLVQAFVYICFGLGIVRPFWALCGYLFLVFLQPEWIWRFEGLAGFSYQKTLILCILLGVLFHLSNGNGFRRNLFFLFSSGVFVLIAWISMTGSIQPFLSVPYFDVVWKSVLIMLVLFHTLDTPKKAMIVSVSMVAGSFYNAFRLNDDYLAVGWCRWVRDNWGFKGDSNVICLFEMPCIAISAALLISAKSKYLKIFSALSLLVHVHMVFILESRGAMLGLVTMAIIGFVFIPKSPKTLLVTLLVVLSVAVVAGPPVVKEFSSIFAAKEQRDVSADSRFKLWRAAFLIASDYPFLGVGPYAGQYLIPKYERDYAYLELKHPHNIFLEIASGCGFPALFFYLCLFIMPMVMSWKLRRQYYNPNDQFLQFITIAPLIGFPAMAITGFFCGSGMMESVYYYIGICLGGLVSYRRLKIQADQDNEEEDPIMEWVEDFDEGIESPEFANLSSVR